MNCTLLKKFFCISLYFSLTNHMPCVIIYPRPSDLSLVHEKSGVLSQMSFGRPAEMRRCANPQPDTDNTGVGSIF